MISFIVIGRNEGWKLTKCLEKVFETIKNNNLREYEVIYVDSNSSDDSIDRAREYSGTKIFKITGHYNAAIARNIGAKESSGDVLFFIDGDMEIQADFLPLVYNGTKGGLLYKFVSGQFVDYNYDYDGTLLDKCEYHELESDKIEFTTGGLFLITKEYWQKVNGMKNKLRRSQDIDLAIRLAGIGIFLIRKKELLAFHHTIPYHHHKRTWKMLLNGSGLYRSVLMRDNITNYYQWKLFLRENYSSILFLMVVISCFVFRSPVFVALYLMIIAVRVFKKRATIIQKFNLLFYYFLRDISIWFSICFFWPSSKNESEYKRI